MIQTKINILQSEINKILNTIVDFTCDIKLIEKEKSKKVIVLICPK